MVLINCIFQNFIHTIFPSVDWLFLFFFNLNDSSRKIVIYDLTTLRQIFVQLLLIKSGFWQHLSSVLATLSLRKWNSSNKSNIVIDIYFKRKIFLRIFCLRLNNYCHAWQTLTTIATHTLFKQSVGNILGRLFTRGQTQTAVSRKQWASGIFYKRAVFIKYISFNC